MRHRAILAPARPTDAGHFIQHDQPEAVARAILDVQSAIAKGPGAWPGGTREGD